MIYTRLRHAVGSALEGFPGLRRLALRSENLIESGLWSLAERIPALIGPRPFQLTMAITARCNARCLGCRYERDFMVARELPLGVVREALDDARAAGIYKVRLYGGEPLLHPDLPAIVAHGRAIGIEPVVTTNGVLLDRRIDELHAAGLRDLTIGYYGSGEAGDRYMQRRGYAERILASLRAVRERFGSGIDMQLNWLLMRPSCSVARLHEAYGLARELDMKFQLDLVHYSLPYFSEGPDRELQFRPEDRSRIEEVVAELLRLREEDPERIRFSPEYLRSIPDWLLRGPEMRVPCTVQRLIWIGADGTVQLCYVTYRLGNLHETRLRDLLFTPEHVDAARRAFRLDCPNCHCEAGERVMRHARTRRRYAR